MTEILSKEDLIRSMIKRANKIRKNISALKQEVFEIDDELRSIVIVDGDPHGIDQLYVNLDNGIVKLIKDLKEF